MRDRFVPQTIRNAVLRGKRRTMDQAGNSPPNTAIRTAPTANNRPVVRPPLRSTWIIPSRPRIREAARTIRLNRKVMPTHLSLGLSTRGTLTANKLGASNTSPQSAKRKDAVGRSPILTTDFSFVSEQPQTLQHHASLGFSSPHFEQLFELPSFSILPLPLVRLLVATRLWLFPRVRCSALAGRLESPGTFRPSPG
jgi:hypothetical protein